MTQQAKEASKAAQAVAKSPCSEAQVAKEKANIAKTAGSKFWLAEPTITSQLPLNSNQYGYRYACVYMCTQRPCMRAHIYKSAYAHKYIMLPLYIALHSYAPHTRVGLSGL